MIKGEAPGWAVWKPEFALDFLAEHSIDFWLQSEDLPDANNRVTIDHDGQIVLNIRESNLEGHKRLTAKLKAMLTEIGCHDQLMDRSLYLGKNIPIGGTAHQAGTVRFGVDPRTSALDLELQGARFGQPLRGRRKLLCVDCRREPQPDDHGERTAGWRPLAVTAGISTGSQVEGMENS
jgi:hypothetical protein